MMDEQLKQKLIECVVSFLCCVFFSCFIQALEGCLKATFSPRLYVIERITK